MSARRFVAAVAIVSWCFFAGVIERHADGFGEEMWFGLGGLAGVALLVFWFDSEAKR